MDRATELADAFVELKFADYEPFRTQVARRTLDPVWNEDFRFEVSDDSDLQNEPLEIKVLDYDTITYNDAIGLVFVDLNSLLASQCDQINGWFPIFDTLRGVRGELCIQVKLQFFGDNNPFKDSSAGVRFFSVKKLPVQSTVLGLVSALDVSDDPEFHWTESFRTPRTSNEARTRIMFQLSGQLRRLIGKRVLELGGNAVVGYIQKFDVEKEDDVIFARAYGTAVIYGKPSLIGSPKLTPAVMDGFMSPLSLPRISVAPLESEQLLSTSPTSSNPVMEQVSSLPLKSGDHILTLTSFPASAILATGGFVSAASVKIIENTDKETRALWWMELREELKTHAKSLGCNSLVGYSEQLSIEDDVALFHCTATAVVLNFNCFLEEEDLKKSRSRRNSACQSVHASYNRNDSPFPMAFVKCGCCGKCHVPEILLCGIQPSADLEVIGKGALVEAHVCRQKKAKVGESIATIVSEAVPFILYDIHQQLIHKLKIRSLNSIFGLKISITIGDSLIAATATGTALFLKALPLPPALKLFRNLEVVDEEDQLLLDLQKKITLQSEINRNHIENVLAVDRNLVELNKKALKEDNDSEYSEDSPDLIDDLDLEDNPIRNRSVVVQIDDEQDEDLILLLDPSFPDGFLNFNIGFQLSNIESSESVGFDYNLSTQQLQMITLVKQAVVNPAHHPNRQLSAMFKVLFQEIQLQLSYFSPCLISGINYSIQLPKENEVQIFMTAVAIGELALIEDVEPFNFEPSNFEPEDSQLNLSASTPSAASFVSGAASLIRKNLRQMTKSSIVTREIYEMASVASEDDIHPIESQDGLDQQPSRFSNASKSSQPDESAVMKTQDFVHQIAPTIDITPLPFVANKTIEQYIGRLSLHFVKEANLIFETGIGLAGMGGFSHSFLVDFYSVLRAHTCALGGNALISVSMDEHVFSESIKNQGYGILSVSGDVVKAVSPPTCDVATQELLEK